MSASDYFLGGIDFSGILVMDAGTGAGGTTLRLAEKVAEVGGTRRIVSIDIDPGTFPEVKKNLGKHSDLVAFIKADLTRMPQIESESFDLVVCTATMCAVNDRPLKALQALAEFHRVLKEEGQLIIEDEYPLPRATEPDEEVQVLRWQLYKAVAELIGEGHYTEIYPEELEYAASMAGFRDIEWRRFEGGSLQKNTLEEWRRVMPPMTEQIGHEPTRHAVKGLIKRIYETYEKEGGRNPPRYVMKMKK